MTIEKPKKGMEVPKGWKVHEGGKTAEQPVKKGDEQPPVDINDIDGPVGDEAIRSEGML